MAKWFEMYRCQSSVVHTLCIRIYLDDVVKDPGNGSFRTRQEFGINLQANLENDENNTNSFYATRYGEIDLEIDFARVAKVIKVLDLGKFATLTGILEKLQSLGYQPCEYHPRARRYFPLDKFPELPYWEADNKETEVGVFADSEERAEDLLFKEFAKRAGVDGWESRYAQKGLQEWLANGKHIRNHGVYQSKTPRFITEQQPATVTA